MEEEEAVVAKEEALRTKAKFSVFIVRSSGM